MIKRSLCLSLLLCIAGSYASDMSTEAIQKRIEPVGRVNVAPEATKPISETKPAEQKQATEQKQVAQPQVTADGKATYEKYCVLCHGSGAAGAPKLGDKEAWKPRIAEGMEKLVEHSIKGLNAMPPKGTCMDCTDAQLKATVEYMVSQSKS